MMFVSCRRTFVNFFDEFIYHFIDILWMIYRLLHSSANFQIIFSFLNFKKPGVRISTWKISLSLSFWVDKTRSRYAVLLTKIFIRNISILNLKELLLFTFLSQSASKPELRSQFVNPENTRYTIAGNCRNYATGNKPRLRFVRNVS